MCTKFNVDSSSHFPVGAQAHRHADKQIDATEHPTHASGYARMGKYTFVCISLQIRPAHDRIPGKD